MDESLEQQKLDLEKRRLELDAELRGREIALREREVSAARGRGIAFTGPQATVLVAVFGLLSGTAGAFISGYFQREVGGIEASGAVDVEETRAQGQLDLERLKFESSLILKAIEQEEQSEALKALRFFANAGLIPTHKDDILAMREEQIPRWGANHARVLLRSRK